VNFVKTRGTGSIPANVGAVKQKGGRGILLLVTGAPGKTEQGRMQKEERLEGEREYGLKDRIGKVRS